MVDASPVAKFRGKFREQAENPDLLKKLYGYFIGILAVSLTVTIFLLPVTCYYFHRISLISLPANLTTVPILGFWVIPVGLLSAIVLPFSQQAAPFLSIPAHGVWT